MRALIQRKSWITWLVIGFVTFYVISTLLTLGFFFESFSRLTLPGVSPVLVVNQYLLAAFLSLFFIRFLFQKTPRMKIVPYLHLPVSRTSLATFFQVSSLATVHNVYPFLFFIPFWMRFVVPDAGLAAASSWMLAVVLLILASHFAILYLRSTLQQHTGLFYVLTLLLVVTAVIDEWLGAGLQRMLSEFLFTDILRGSLLGTAFVASFTALGVVLSTRSLLSGLRPDPPSATREHPWLRLPRTAERLLAADWGAEGQLIRLELLLMWRNRRPRHYLIISLLFSTMYLAFMLGPGNRITGAGMNALIGLFASGGFILNYGQLMFGWDSSYYPALVTRNIAYRTLVKSKLVVLQASCLVLFAISLPLFLLLAPDRMDVHFAFLFYNAGITSVLVMELAARNRQAIDIGRSGGFFNYEGLSSRHWIWFIPTALPPVLFMMAMGNHRQLALGILASVGFVSIMATNLWARYFARGLQARKQRMLTGFRE
ncbi:MAG: hypothetical protein COV99_12710 [Bacteroidetes bacterium CG12_big_fil_rev_8_21_14_0_65_60_17]|nr:MAG: hypothetical protein COV99_12710 [Bacteroidetes bacterium CG12_big_fil_rev_8_21_14_0_65_60_17]